MKKVTVVLACTAMVLGLVSCASKKAAEEDLGAPEGLEMFVEESDGPVWEDAGKKLTNDSCNTFAADTGAGTTFVVDKDISKDGKEVLGAEVSLVKYLGEECLKITPNYNNEIRFAIVFDSPVSAADLKGLTYSISGFDGGIGSFNVGVMYEDKNGPEHLMSFYLGESYSDVWSEYKFSLAGDEQWGSNFNADRKIIAVQLWSGDKGPIFLKDLSFTK